MDTEQFLSECNKTPLLKRYREKEGTITRKLLLRIGFTRKTYELRDLVSLKELLLGFQQPEKPKSLEKVYKAKREAKDLRHQWAIKNFDNQKFVMQLRKELKMPFENRGFIIKKREGAKTELEFDLELNESYDNMNFGFSPEFENWFFRNSTNRKDYDEWERVSASNWEEISAAVNKTLTKWDLPRRYEKAVRELILFNRIIPAASGIRWSSTRRSIDGAFEESITYDADTTKDELKKTIDQDQYRIYKNRRKYLPGKPARAKRNLEKSEEMINFYNSRKKTGADDQNIFQEIIRQYELSISMSAVRKRIKGK